ncbi:hypothetical protein VIBNIFTn2_120182 [Vibrio nigripulchritudo FTn2]|uniref:hypothetical protein n=1 Tax=Vibrio nigripulchritudo TaxID=28173 RepID=UPI0003B1B8BB|nr:hypothetical protein [Vibrio nigripulchritudo]CCN40200.1 hypothetical protein VIBNIFTn2_120182 [Vibrio nigripulchritudo FTn2]
MNSENPLESKLINRSNTVKSAVGYLTQLDEPVSIEKVTGILSLTPNKKTVVRRAFMELSIKDNRVQFIPARQALFYFSQHKCPVRSKIDVAVKLLKADLEELTYPSNTSELTDELLKLESTLNEVLNHQR